jgi:hypothetical protein
MEKITAADIRDMVTMNQIQARKIAFELNDFATRVKIANWELSLDSTGFFLDGWDARGKEVCHRRIDVS